MRTFFHLALLGLLICAPRLGMAQVAGKESGLLNTQFTPVQTGVGYDMASGNLWRQTSDLNVPGALGKYGLKVVRTMITQTMRPLGAATASYRIDWNFSNCYYVALLRTEEDYRSVRYPDMSVVTFKKSGSEYISIGRSDRLIVNADKTPQKLILDDATVIEFESLPTSASVAGTRITDPQGLVTTLSIFHQPTGSNEPIGPLVITDPVGNSLTFQYDAYYRPQRIDASDGDFVAYQWSDTISAFWSTYEVNARIIYGAPTSHYVLNRVDYSDGTWGAYAYMSMTFDGTPANVLFSFCDPRSSTGMKAAEYSYVYQASDNANAGGNYAVEKEKNFADNSKVVSKRQVLDTSPERVVCKEIIGDNSYRTLTYKNIKQSAQYFDASNGLVLAEESDFCGDTTVYSYDSNTGLLTSIKDPKLNVTSFTRANAVGLVTRITNPDTTYREFFYTQLGNGGYYLFVTRDERGNPVTYDRNANGLVTKVTYPDNSTEEWRDYNSFAQACTHQLRNGSVETFEYDARGRLKKHTLPAVPGRVDEINYTYYEPGHAWCDRVKTVTNPRGHKTTYEYDLKFDGSVQTSVPCHGRGNVTKIINDDLSYKSFGYTDDGLKEWEENELRKRTTYVYDEYRRLVSATSPEEQPTVYSYETSNDGSAKLLTRNTPRHVTLPTGRKTSYTYDSDGYKKTEEKGSGSSEATTTTWTYDACHNVQSMTQQVGGGRSNRVVEYEYDSRNRLLKQTAPLSRITQWTYDGVGNVITTTYPDATVCTNEYSAMNSVVKKWDELDQLTQLEYNSAGLVNTITDPRNGIYSMEYDSRGRLLARDYPSVSGIRQRESWEYDGAGNVEYYTNRSGQRRGSVYDARERLTRQYWVGSAAPEVNIEYFIDGKVKKRTNSNGSIDYTYSDAGYPQTEVQAVAGGPTYAITYGHNADGLKCSFESTAGIWMGYTYTNRNQPYQILYGAFSGPNYCVWSASSYNLAGDETGKSIYNGSAIENQYDDAGRLDKRLSYKAASGSWILKQTFGYDSRDRRVWQVRDDGYGDLFGYQADGQLTTYKHDVMRPDLYPTGSASWSEGFVYDASGNRSQFSDASVMMNYGANALNQYSSITNSTIGYDSRGNQQAWDDWTYQFDADNRLTRAQKTGYAVDFYYDPAGRLSKVNRNGSWEYRYYDGANEYLRTQANGTWIRFMTWGNKPGEIISQWSSAYGHMFHVQDPIGSSVAISNIVGDVNERYLYDAFGREELRDGNWGGRVSSAIDNYWTFAGQELMVDLGINNFKNRFYLSDVGRFLQPDPISFQGGDLNLYRYVGNDPINFMDPLGLAANNAGLLNAIWADFTNTQRGTPFGEIKYAGQNFLGGAGVAIHIYNTTVESVVVSMGGNHADAEVLAFFAPLAAGNVTNLAKRFVAAESGAARLALPAPRQVAGNWGVNTYKHGGQMSAIEHINYRHAFNSGFKDVSRFAEGTSVRNIQGFVDDALRYGKVTPQGATGFQIEYNLGRAIGTNQSGGAATGIRVFIRDGNIQTAFPISFP